MPFDFSWSLKSTTLSELEAYKFNGVIFIHEEIKNLYQYLVQKLKRTVEQNEGIKPFIRNDAVRSRYCVYACKSKLFTFAFKKRQNVVSVFILEAIIIISLSTKLDPDRLSPFLCRYFLCCCTVPGRYKAESTTK